VRRQFLSQQAFGGPGASLSLTKPITPAASTISGNGTPRKKIPINARAARAIIGRLLSARLPTRWTACNTIASTAALSPKNSAAIVGTLPNAA